MTMTGTNERWLRAKTALSIAYEAMEPYLVVFDLARFVPEPDGKFIYQYNDTNKSSDAKKKKPVLYEQGASFPEIDFSRPKWRSQLMESNGFSVRVPRNVIRQAAGGKNELVRAYENAGFWLGEWLGANVLTTMIAGATTPTWTPPATWDNAAGTATPVEDLRKLKYAMRREGYPYRLTNAYVHTDNLSELEAYLTAMDISATKQQNIYGTPGGNGDSIYVPVAGCKVTGLDSGITEGGILAMDEKNKVAEFHYTVDSKYGGGDRISYKTMVDGREVTKTVPNIGLHFHSFDENDTHDTVLQFWVEGATVITNSLGILYDTGI
jgi:hypothetical protein